MSTSAHVRRPERPRERGQATVETVGIIVAVALLLAATGAWLSGSVSLPKPPDLIGAIARVFGRDEPAGPRPGLDVPGAGGYVRLDHGEITPETDPWIGRPLSRAGAAVKHAAVATVRFVGTYGELPAACGREFTAGFLERVKERALALVVDPRELLRALREIGQNPEAALRGLPNPADLVGYVRDLWSMSWSERALRISRDSGRTAADIAVDTLTRGAARFLKRLPKGPTPKRPAPTTPRGDGHRPLQVGDAVVMR